jgi:hypothetical protein
VGVCLYTTSKAGGPALPIKSAVSSCDPVLLAQVRDATTFLDDAVDLLRHASRAARSADKTKVEVNYQEKEIAGKPSRLITVRRGEQGSGKDRPQVFLLTALDGQTVLGCLLPDREKAEATVTKFSKQGDRSLAANASLQKTRKLLPDKLQVELLLDLQTFGILGQSDSGKTQVSHVAPLGFAMRALPAALEAQFVVPFDALKAVVDASKAKAKEKEK